MRTDIQNRLFSLRDEPYRNGCIKLLPTVNPDTVIGVRVPLLRQLSKELKHTKEAAAFLSLLPHEYFEEYHLHSFLLTDIKDFDEAVGALERFLPFVDNWSVCDSIRLKALKKNPDRALSYIDKWLLSDHPYTVRFAILCLMNDFLDDRFDKSYLEKVSAIRRDEYYVKMMVAWYFATALAKQYDDAVLYLQNRSLDLWTHHKAIQKSVESYRIPDERKNYLKTLR